MKPEALCASQTLPTRKRPLPSKIPPPQNSTYLCSASNPSMSYHSLTPASILGLFCRLPESLGLHLAFLSTCCCQFFSTVASSFPIFQLNSLYCIHHSCLIRLLFYFYFCYPSVIVILFLSYLVCPTTFSPYNYLTAYNKKKQNGWRWSYGMSRNMFQ